MKSIKILLFALIVPICMSCEDDFLVYEPVDEITAADFFQNEDEFVQFINGAYNEYDFDEGSARTWIEVGNHPLGDFYQHHDMENGEIWLSTFRTTRQLWGFHYKVFNKMNILIEKLDNLTDPSQRQRVESEARFIRGFALLMLYRNYGGVPITPVPDASNPTSYPRNTEEETMNFLMDDLNFAVDNLPETWSEFEGYGIGRPLKGSALGFRMLANMYNEDWDAVITDFTEMETSARGYALLDDYRDLYRTTSENSTESLFEIQYLGGITSFGRAQNGHWLNEVTIPRRDTQGGAGKWSTNGGWGQWSVSEVFVNSFENGDLRRASTIIGVGDTYIGEFFNPSDTFVVAVGDYDSGFGTTKYFTGPEYTQGNGNGSSLNIHVLRYAEAIMFYAEALAKKGDFSGAYEQLNRVRRRAGLTDKNGGDLNQFMVDLTQEKRHEGFAESNTWPELVRMGEAERVLLEDYGVVMESRWQLLPIPQEEHLANPEIEPNPGY